jgi:hypothetical protein
MRSSAGKGSIVSLARAREPILRCLAAALVAVIAVSAEARVEEGEPSAVGVQAPRDIASFNLPASRRPYRLADVTRSVGIPVTGTRSWGAAFVDYDHNGWPDALVGRHLRRPWFRTNTEGSFAPRRIHDLVDPAGNRTYYDRHSCAWGEASADGRPDLFYASGAQKGKGTGPNQLLIQTSNGDLVNRANRYGVTDLLGRGRSANWLDFNRDGRLDLLVGNERRPSHPNVMFKRGRGRHYARAAVGVGAELATTSSSWADWTRDGKADVLVLVQGLSGAVAYRNAGGRYRPVSIPRITGRRWLSGTWGDCNGDGWPDLAAVSADRLLVLRNERGSFRPAYSPKAESGASGGMVRRGERRGPRPLSRAGLPQPFGRREPSRLSHRQGSRWLSAGTPRDVSGTQGGGGDSVATADYDRDGRVDLLVTNGYEKAWGRVELLRNKTESGRWIAVELAGGRRNPLALGARVHVRADRLSYWREVTDGVSFWSQSEVNPVHLGLRRARVARLRVVWPGSARSCLRVLAGARIRVARGDHPC